MEISKKRGKSEMNDRKETGIIFSARARELHNE